MSTAYDPNQLVVYLSKARQREISPENKGFTAIGPVSPGQLIDRQANLRELTLPVMVLRADALASNVDTMAAWCREHGVELAPHGKTSMSPELTARQLTAGAWGITAATIAQVRAYVDAGVRRVLLANQLVDPVGIAWLAEALSTIAGLEVLVYVDSIDGVALLDRELRAAGLEARLSVLVEIGVPGRRTGARGVAAADAVARAAYETETLAVVGVSAFEGVVGHDRDEPTMTAVAELCRSVRQLGLSLSADGIIDGPPIVSAGGSTFFDVVAAELSGPEPATVVLRSGGYLTHDDGLYAEATPLPTGGSPYALTAALDVWAYVLSRPEPQRVLVGAGRRDVPFDVSLPIVRRAQDRAGTQRSVDGVTVSALNDQHAFLDVPSDSDLAVGDLVCFGLSHPCTAFDKWRVVPIVSADGTIVDVAHTLF